MSLVRLARPEDHAEVAALFLELATDEPGPTETRFVAEMQKTTYIVEREGRVAGYLFAQFLRSTAYIRHVAIAPNARRSGVGSALFARARAEATARGCAVLCLNVKPENVPAIRLYEREGLAFKYASAAHRFTFSALPGHPVEGVRARVLTANRDAEAESLFGLPDGQLAMARALPGRVVLGLFRGTGEPEIAGLASFDPGFPGSFPFRVTSPDLVPALLDGCRAHARKDTMNVIVEDAPEVSAWFARQGAPARMEFSHYAGAL